MLGQGAMGGLLNLGAFVGGHQSIEADLTIARSQAVLVAVVGKLHLVGRPGFGDETKSEIKLRHKVNLEALRGSVLQIRATDAKPEFAEAIVSTYAEVIKERLAALSLEQAAQKRTVTTGRLGEARIQLARTQAALTQFRAQNRLAAPEVQLGAAVTNVANLQARLQAKQAELAAMQQFVTANNIQVAAVKAEIAGLQGQIAHAQGDSSSNLGAMSQIMAQYTNLYREEKSVEVLAEIYQRYLEQITVEELSASSNMDTIEPPFVEPARQYNLPAVGLLFLFIAMGVGAEIYIANPPVGRKQALRDGA